MSLFKPSFSIDINVIFLFLLWIDSATMTKNYLASKNAATKQHRADVDRKASKGRKIK